MSITQRGRQFKKGVIFPILYEVSEKCEDEYWKQLFFDLSIGKIIKNINISNGHISCTSKRKGFQYFFIHKTADEIIIELIPLLISNFITCSEKNVKIKNIVEQIKKENDDMKQTKWSKIRRKNIKLSLISDYIISLQKNNNIPWNNCTHVYNILVNNFNSHIMTKIVSMEDGKIKSIDGLEVKDNVLVFNHNFYDNDKIEYNKEEVDDEENNECEENLEIIWESYIKRYFKNIRMMLS